MAGVYSPEAKEELRDKIFDELEVEFGTSDDSAVLDKYAHAIARALAVEFYKHGYFPDEDDYPVP